MAVPLQDLILKLKNLRAAQEEAVSIKEIEDALQQTKGHPEPSTADRVSSSTKTRPFQPGSDTHQKVALAFKRGDRAVAIKNRATSSIFNRRASTADDKTATAVTSFEEECNDKNMYTTTLQHLGMYVNINMDFSNDLIPVYRELAMPEIPLPPEEIPKNTEGKVTALGKLI